jgi:hypothetical protein
MNLATVVPGTIAPAPLRLLWSGQDFSRATQASAFGAYAMDDPPQGLKPLQREERAILRHG